MTTGTRELRELYVLYRINCISETTLHNIVRVIPDVLDHLPPPFHALWYACSWQASRQKTDHAVAKIVGWWRGVPHRTTQPFLDLLHTFIRRDDAEFFHVRRELLLRSGDPHTGVANLELCCLCPPLRDAPSHVMTVANLQEALAKGGTLKVYLDCFQNFGILKHNSAHASRVALVERILVRATYFYHLSLRVVGDRAMPSVPWLQMIPKLRSPLSFQEEGEWSFPGHLCDKCGNNLWLPNHRKTPNHAVVKNTGKRLLLCANCHDHLLTLKKF